MILVATGSEVQLAVEARETLEQGVATRVVSMPCREWFAAQGMAYREKVLPKAVRARVSIEAGATQGWREVVGDAGRSSASTTTAPRPTSRPFSRSSASPPRQS